MIADRAAFEAQVAEKGSGEGNATISAALSELEEELARLDATSVEATSLQEPEPIRTEMTHSDEDTEIIEEVDEDIVAEVDEEVVQPIDDTPPDSEQASDAGDPSAAEADEHPAGEDEEYGESRYSRKSRHLPTLEADHAPPSTGSGLRSAIIRVPNKRGDGS